MLPLWCSTSDLASIAGLTARQVRTLCKAGYAFGQKMIVREVNGRGGRGGSTYQINVNSLPDHFQERLKLLQSPVEAHANVRFGPRGQSEREWKFDVIRAALAHPKRSRERRAEINRLVGTKRLDWAGKYRTLTRATLYAWIDIYELEGVHGLAQKVRRDKGKKRVYISRNWMKSVPFDDETKAAIERDIKQYVRGLIAGDGQFKQTLVLTSEKLKKITAAYGFRVNDPVQESEVFRIPQAFVQAESQYKAVARHRKDRKASEDNKPRIRRTTAGLQPMEVVVMDVHHVNIHLTREQGTYSTPKLIAFHDIATNRVFCELIQFDDRGGVRNSDIITAFVRMCMHPAFGVPQFLYADNGSEYGFADDLADALKLGSKVIPFDGPQERNRIIRAKPYNAAAKHVEGWFRQFNQQHARHIQGWRDDDPMNPKRPHLGKLHAPYPGSFDEFCNEFYSHLTAYEHMPQKGQLKTSPALAFKRHVQAGWRATILDPKNLLTVFTRPETRVVRQHGVEVRGQVWTCDGLLEFFGRTVLVHIPKYHGFEELLITDEYENRIGVAVSDRAFHVLDERGAKESARRTSVRNKALTKLGKSVPKVDVGAELIAFGGEQLPVVPNPPDDIISVPGGIEQPRAILPVPASKNSRLAEEERLRAENEQVIGLMAKLANPRRN